jgi:hypothetical protein
MGLDMYLHRKTYVKNWDFMDPEELHQVEVKINNEVHPYINLKIVSTIEEEVGYWRKANAIHKWFVDNVQDGEDDCREYDVEWEKLEELLAICKKVKENHDRGANESDEIDEETPENLLPTQSGFFFGNTDYDEWYYRDIDSTINILEPLVELNKKIHDKINDDNKSYKHIDVPNYSYQSSW